MPVPRAAPRAGYPATYTPTAPTGTEQRPQVFDPALKHVPHGFRSGDPVIGDPGDAGRWLALRRRAADHVLRAIAESAWGDRLVLRGSRLLKAWVGGSAREPGDLDWLVDPPTLAPADPGAAGLMGDLVAAVFARPDPPELQFARAGVATDDIWTYERAEGRRVVFPWRAAGLPDGAVQVDVVFREPLADPDRRVSVPAADGGCVSVRAATPAQALAWKLLWLATDSYPQGKDLYDAVLLAERFALPREVLAETFRLGGATAPATAAAVLGSRPRVDWANFVREYPELRGTDGEWQARLVAAIGPTFRATPAARPEAPTLEPAWLTPTVVQLARAADADRDFDLLPILADALQDAGCDDADLLEHLRCAGPHARGCCTVDWVLGNG